MARSNAYLGLVTANMINLHWYVFNQINYVRWQDRDVVDQTIAEFFQLLPSACVRHATLFV